MTQHTNTRNRMPVHVLMKQYARRTHVNARKRPCTCDCTSITSAHRNTQADRERMHLPRGAHPHAPSSAQPRTRSEHPRIYSPPGATHADAHRQPPVRAQSTLHALTLTHTRFQHEPACQEQFILQLGVRRQRAPSRTLQTDSAAGTDTLPIPPKSPSLPPAHLHLTP